MIKRNVLLPQDFHSSLLSYEKDLDEILNKLFIQSRPYSDDLKRLLIINNPDCLDDKTNPDYNKAIQYSVSDLKEQGYINIIPKLAREEHDIDKNIILITMDNFSPTTNPQFRDCYITFDIICNIDNWDLGNFRLRPLKIAGYIDGILNNCKLTGIGTLNFVTCKELLLDPTTAGYSLVYQATHGSDDYIPAKEG